MYIYWFVSLFILGCMRWIKNCSYSATEKSVSGRYYQSFYQSVFSYESVSSYVNSCEILLIVSFILIYLYRCHQWNSHKQENKCLGRWGSDVCDWLIMRMTRRSKKDPSVLEMISCVTFTFHQNQIILDDTFNWISFYR
jgi:hypothetical protein